MLFSRRNATQLSANEATKFRVGCRQVGRRLHLAICCDVGLEKRRQQVAGKGGGAP